MPMDEPFPVDGIIVNGMAKVRFVSAACVYSFLSFVVVAAVAAVRLVWGCPRGESLERCAITSAVSPQRRHALVSHSIHHHVLYRNRHVCQW
jgi:hypothetical protein